MVTKLRPSNSSIPDHVWLQKFGGGAAPPDHTYLTGGHLGMAYAPMLIGEKHDDNPASPDFRVRAFDAKNDLSARQQRSRRDLLQDAQSLSVAGNGPEFESFEIHQRRAFELLHGQTAKQAFEIEKEDERVRDGYGRNPLGQNLLLARRLIEAGVRLVNVAAWTGLAPGEKFVSVETWDMHGNADVGIFENGWNGLPFALSFWWVNSVAHPKSAKAPNASVAITGPTAIPRCLPAGVSGAEAFTGNQTNRRPSLNPIRLPWRTSPRLFSLR
jgi:hypothetical protein